MSLAATVRAMAESGCSAEQIAAVVERVEGERVERKRVSNRERQRRFKDKNNANNALSALSSVSGVTDPSPPFSPPSLSPTPPNPTPPISPQSTPSLRSGGASAKRVKSRSQIEPDAQPGEPDRLAAEAAGLSNAEFRDEWRKFRDHHRAKGSLMADWSAAWRTWLAKSAQFRTARAGPSAFRDNRNGFGQIAAELWGDEIGRSEKNTNETAGWISFDNGGVERNRSGNDRVDNRDNGAILDLDPFGCLSRTG